MHAGVQSAAQRARGRLTKDSGVTVFLVGIARAGVRLQPAAIDNDQLSAAVTDELAVLKRAGRSIDTGATHTEHRGDELLSDIELIGVGSVAGHQEPARQAGFHAMEMGADDGLTELVEPEMEVTVQAAPQHGAMLEFTTKWRRTHAPRRAGSAYDGALQRDIDPKKQREPNHALVAHETHLQMNAVIAGNGQGYEASRGEVDVTNPAFGLTQHIGKIQLDLLAA